MFYLPPATTSSILRLESQAINPMTEKITKPAKILVSAQVIETSKTSLQNGKNNKKEKMRKQEKQNIWINICNIMLSEYISDVITWPIPSDVHTYGKNTPYKLIAK